MRPGQSEHVIKRQQRRVSKIDKEGIDSDRHVAYGLRHLDEY